MRAGLVQREQFRRSIGKSTYEGIDFEGQAHDLQSRWVLAEIGLTNDFFEWDDEKALANVRSHGVTFEEASTIFEDAYSITELDTASSDFEDRFVTIGLSLVSRSLFVVHTEREERIRIISARKATPSEWAAYEEQR